jgi:hypothetical protein
MVYIEVTWGAEVKLMLIVHNANAEIVMVVDELGDIFVRY